MALGYRRAGYMRHLHYAVLWLDLKWSEHATLGICLILSLGLFFLGHFSIPSIQRYSRVKSTVVITDTKLKKRKTHHQITSAELNSLSKLFLSFSQITYWLVGSSLCLSQIDPWIQSRVTCPSCFLGVILGSTLLDSRSWSFVVRSLGVSCATDPLDPVFGNVKLCVSRTSDYRHHQCHCHY